MRMSPNGATKNQIDYVIADKKINTGLQVQGAINMQDMGALINSKLYNLDCTII